MAATGLKPELVLRDNRSRWHRFVPWLEFLRFGRRTELADLVQRVISKIERHVTTACVESLASCR